MNTSKLLVAAAAISVVGAATFAYAQSTPASAPQSPAAMQPSPDAAPVQVTPPAPVAPMTPPAADGSTTDTGKAGMNNGVTMMPSDAGAKGSMMDGDKTTGERAARADRN